MAVGRSPQRPVWGKKRAAVAEGVPRSAPVESRAVGGGVGTHTATPVHPHPPPAASDGTGAENACPEQRLAQILLAQRERRRRRRQRQRERKRTAATSGGGGGCPNFGAAATTGTGAAPATADAWTQTTMTADASTQTEFESFPEVDGAQAGKRVSSLDGGAPGTDGPEPKRRCVADGPGPAGDGTAGATADGEQQHEHGAATECQEMGPISINNTGPTLTPDAAAAQARRGPGADDDELAPEPKRPRITVTECDADGGEEALARAATDGESRHEDATAAGHQGSEPILNTNSSPLATDAMAAECCSSPGVAAPPASPRSRTRQEKKKLKKRMQKLKKKQQEKQADALAGELRAEPSRPGSSGGPTESISNTTDSVPAHELMATLKRVFPQVDDWVLRRQYGFCTKMFSDWEDLCHPSFPYSVRGEAAFDEETGQDWALPEGWVVSEPEGWPKDYLALPAAA